MYSVCANKGEILAHHAYILRLDILTKEKIRSCIPNIDLLTKERMIAENILWDLRISERYPWV